MFCRGVAVLNTVCSLSAHRANDRTSHASDKNTTFIFGPFYTTHQRQRCGNSTMTLGILFSLKTMESLQIGVATNFQETALFSMKTVLLVSSQSCRNIDSDAWCKRVLTKVNVTAKQFKITTKQFLNINA